MTNLLFVTQVMDQNDSVLGFSHGWIKALAPFMETITVVCLFEGEHDLPDNVRVFSLGKEDGAKPSYVYALRFLSIVWKMRASYDSVFVHMNQEYILIAGWLWKILGKRIYVWRNHYAGSWLTDIAAAFCAKVFCTSKHSYTAKYHKTVLMPVGIDTSRFYINEQIKREPRSILFFARISPSKRADLFIEALGLLLGKGISFVASVYGSPIPSDIPYYESLQARAEMLGLHDRVRFHPGVPNEKAPAVFNAHEIFVNCSPNGMFDKMIFEAAAAGCRVVAQSQDWNELNGNEASEVSWEAEDLAELLKEELAAPINEGTSGQVVTKNSLEALTKRLVLEIS
ncbi:MAG: hypothetical protein JWN64_7 [Parcubacteria group bacterium]|nr:hypothetical protein [Parcubacteria group bacterium]